MGANRTLRGQEVAGAVVKLQLFDGKFTTGYRLKRFEVTPGDIITSELVMARLLTTKQGHATTWNWSNNMQVGWAAWNVPTNSRFGQYSLVDEEAVIVEDLYIDMTGDSGEQVNYLIELEAINFSDWRGALAMVQNRSQGKGDA